MTFLNPEKRSLSFTFQFYWPEGSSQSSGATNDPPITRKAMGLAMNSANNHQRDVVGHCQVSILKVHEISTTNQKNL